MTAEISPRDTYEIKEIVMLPVLEEGGQACHAGGHMERSAQEACSAKWVASWEGVRSPGQVPSLGVRMEFTSKRLEGMSLVPLSLGHRGVEEEVVAGGSALSHSPLDA